MPANPKLIMLPVRRTKAWARSGSFGAKAGERWQTADHDSEAQVMLKHLLTRLGWAADRAGPGQAESTCILLVDDDPTLLGFLSHALQHRGYQVATAVDGAEALAKAQRDQPDAIVLDGRMPVLDGFEVLRRLKRDGRTASIPVLMLTACAEGAEVATGLTLGAVEYLTKPVLSGDVLHQLARMVGSPVPYHRTAGTLAL
jgi:CheY-like chemotaxis protein